LPEWSKSKLLGLPSFTTSSSGLKEPTVKSTAEIAKQTRDKDTDFLVGEDKLEENVRIEQLILTNYVEHLSDMIFIIGFRCI